ncbi:hypothetical protein, partial [Escherichia coli]|uniref:hypothetical protein n=1 Tax=Escherichia coli TaxID=562 RepID=UPI003D2F3AA8
IATFGQINIIHSITLLKNLLELANVSLFFFVRYNLLTQNVKTPMLLGFFNKRKGINEIQFI